MTLDDYFPTSNLTGGMALFSHSQKSDLWVLLLEKAYAKLHQNYYTLRGGYVSEALQDLTGNPTKLVELDTDEMRAEKESGRFFLSMEQNLRNGYLVTATTEGEEMWHDIDDKQLPSGLMKAHSYCVLEVR